MCLFRKGSRRRKHGILPVRLRHRLQPVSARARGTYAARVHARDSRIAGQIVHALGRRGSPTPALQAAPIRPVAGSAGEQSRAAPLPCHAEGGVSSEKKKADGVSKRQESYPRLHLRRSSRVAELRRNVRLHGGTIARARDAAAGGCSCAHYPPVFVARQRKGAAARRALATGRASASARTRVLIAWAPVCPLACAPVQNGDPVPGDPRFQYQNQWQTGRCVSCSRRPAQPAACRSTRPIVPPRAPARTRERAETGVCARAGAHKRTRAHPHTQKVHTHARPHAHAKSSHARTTHRLTRTRTRVRTNTGMMNAPCADPVCFCAGLVFCVPVCVCAGIYLYAPSTRICIGQRHKHAQTQTHTHTHTHTHSICTAVRLVSTCVHTYI